MSERPEDLEREGEEEKIRSSQLACKFCGEDISDAAELESYRMNDGYCSRCAHKLNSE